MGLDTLSGYEHSVPLDGEQRIADGVALMKAGARIVLGVVVSADTPDFGRDLLHRELKTKQIRGHANDNDNDNLILGPYVSITQADLFFAPRGIAVWELP